MNAWIAFVAVFVLVVVWITRRKRRLVVSALRIFPIKSCGEVSLKTVKMNSTGFLFDREWMIVDGDNQMVTQRDDSRLLRLNPKLNLNGDQLVSMDLEYEGNTFKLISKPSETIFKLLCQKVDCEGSDEGEEVQQFLKKCFGKTYKLMRIHKHKQVNHDKNFQSLIPDDFKANFTDASQCLVVSTASFAKVKSWVPENMKKDFSIECFRGNVVVEGCSEFEEETWSKFRIGTVEFMGLAKCPRCKVTTVNQRTLEYSDNFEPVNTLRKMNGNGTKGYFGMYCLRLCDGELSVGQEVVVKETRKFPDI
jgi:uncharacterized protein YcbX